MGTTTTKYMNPNINFDKLVLNVKKWEPNADEILDKRVGRQFDNIFSRIKQNDKCICTPKWDEKSECDIHIKVLNRIGSSSSAGEVYKVILDGENVAAKVLPILNDKDFDINQNEIKIAKMASELVKKGISPYFPIVYGSAFCKNTKYSKDSKFKKESDLYHLRKHLRTQIEDRMKQKRFMISTRQLDKKKDIINKSNLDNPNLDYTVTSNVLISELAWGDVGSFVGEYKDKISDFNWAVIISYVLEGIRDMQKYLNVVHEDLHQGNVLMMLFEDSKNLYFICLIHDFGKSIIVKDWTKEYRTSDAIKFFESMKLIASPKIKEYITKSEDILDNHKDGSPVIPKLLKYWGEIKKSLLI